MERIVEPGNSAVCVRCGSAVKFVARTQHRQVIANVYENETWDRVEHYHSSCYADSGSPYGPASS